MNGARNLRMTEAYHVTMKLKENGEYLSPMQVKGIISNRVGRSDEVITNGIFQAIKDYEMDK